MNLTGVSVLSDCQRVAVDFPSPSRPILQPFLSNNTDGSGTLSWSLVNGADNYTVYRFNQPISSINNSLVLIGTFKTNNCVDQNVTNGIYYYAVVATNITGTSVLSNYERIEVRRSKSSTDGTQDDGTPPNY